MKTVLVIPAIDILGGRCVRLVKGDYKQPTVYSENPVEVAADFALAGAEHLHVVDLDAARGTGSNRAVIESILRSHDLKVQVAGGIRTAEAVDAAVGTPRLRTLRIPSAGLLVGALLFLSCFLD